MASIQPSPRHPRPNPHCLISSPTPGLPPAMSLVDWSSQCPYPVGTLYPYYVPTFESLLLFNTCPSCTVRGICPSARPMVNQRSTNAYSCRPILIWIPLLPQLHTVGGSDRRRSSWSTIHRTGEPAPASFSSQISHARHLVPSVLVLISKSCPIRVCNSLLYSNSNSAPCPRAYDRVSSISAFLRLSTPKRRRR